MTELMLILFFLTEKTWPRKLVSSNAWLKEYKELYTLGAMDNCD